MLVHDRVAVDLCVDGRIRLQRMARRLHEERHERELDPLFLFNTLLQSVTKRRDRGHVDLIERGQMRRLVL